MTKQIPMSGKDLAALEEARNLMERGLEPNERELAKQRIYSEPAPQPWFPGVHMEDLRREWIKASELFIQQYPELWRVCYPRRYEEPGGAQYDSPKAVARAMMDAFINYHTFLGRKIKPGTSEQNEALWASRMAERGVPTYYLSRDLAMALMQTTPAQVLDWSTRDLPFEAAAFMLPENLFTHDEYGPVSFIAYVRALQGVSTKCYHPIPRVNHDMDNQADTFSVFLRTKSGMMLHWTYSKDLHMVDLKNDAELEELQLTHSHTSNSGTDQTFTTADIVAMTRAIKLVFNILLFMAIKPEMVEGWERLKKVKQKAGPPIEYWKPHVIGRTYKLRYVRHDLGGTHASPRGHWVSGFMRDQPYGPKLTLRRPTWIEPFWRGGAEE